MASVSPVIGVKEPYVGPQPFKEADEIIFFGRETESQDLFSLIVSHGEVLLYAQSGAGKTSLLNAGVIPMLKRRGLLVRPVARVSGAVPRECKLSDILNIYTLSVLRDWADPGTPACSLAGQSLSDFLGLPPEADESGNNSEAQQPRRPRKPEVLIFDQFEEIFQRYPERPQEREKFFQQVSEALSRAPHLRVVFSIREDYLAQLKPYVSVLPERMKTQFRLERLRESNALKAVTGPLNRLSESKRSFAPNVAEKLVQDLLLIRIKDSEGKIKEVPGEYVEPVQLAVVCDTLWRSLPEGVQEITEEQLKAFGDVGEALSRFYESCIAEAAKVPGVTEARLRRWFSDVLITSEGTRGAVFRGAEQTAGLPNAAVEVFQRLHLIREEQRAGGSLYELSHDRFVAPIQQSNQAWLLKRGPAVEMKARLENRAAAWIGSGRQPDQLLEGNELVEAVRWTESSDAEDLGYSQAVTNLVSQSRLVQDQRELKNAAARAEAEKRRWRLMGRVVVAAIVVLVASTLGYWRLAKKWSRQAREADSRRLALFAHDVVDQDPELGILLALQATKATYDADQSFTSEAESALREGGQKGRLESVLIGHIGVIRDLAFSPDGKRLATASDDGTAKIWDVANGKVHITLAGHTDTVFDLAFAPSGGLLATASLDRTIRVWDSLSGGSKLPIQFSGELSDLAFSEDGNELAAVMTDGKIQTWNVSSGQPSSHSQAELEKTFRSLFGRELVAEPSESSGETLVLRDAVTHGVSYKLHGNAPETKAVTENLNTQHIATAGLDGTIKLWNSSGEQLFALAGQQGVISKLAFTTHGETLAAVGADGTVNLWELSSSLHRRLFTLHPHRSSLTAMAFSPDGSRLATAGENDHVVKLWDVSAGRNSYSLSSSSTSSVSFAISPDASQLAGIDASQKVVLQDVASGKVTRTFEPEVYRLYPLAFSRDGKRLAGIGFDSTLYGWDVSSPAALFHSRGYSRPVTALVFSADGNQIITAGTDNTVQIWDAVSGRQLHSFPAPIKDRRPILSPDAKHLAIIDQSDSLKMFDIASGKESYPVPLQAGGSPLICFSHSGEQFATWDAVGGLRLWQTSTGQPIRSFDASSGGFNTIAFTGDDKQLTAFSSRVANANATIKVWNTDSSRLVHSIPQPADRYIVALNADQTRLVALSYAQTGRSTAGAKHYRRVTYRYDMNIYPLAIKELMDMAKTRITRSFSTQECRDYYLSGPPCKAAGLVEEGIKLAQDGNVEGAVTSFTEAKRLDSLIPFDPRVEAGRLAAEPLLAKARDLARSGDVDRATQNYDKAKQFDQNIVFDSKTEAKQMAVHAKIEQGDIFLLTPLTALDAMNAYQKALDLNPQSNIAAEKWNSICWDGAMNGHPREVLPACERAVLQASANIVTACRDSRGLARALSGNTQGAIEDFEAFINNPTDARLVDQRKEWVTALKAGQNPFTPDVLRSLQGQ